jgi:hypothetical protein
MLSHTYHAYQSISPRNKPSYLESLKLKYSRNHLANRPTTSRPALQDYSHQLGNREEQYRSEVSLMRNRYQSIREDMQKENSHGYSTLRAGRS